MLPQSNKVLSSTLQMGWVHHVPPKKGVKVLPNYTASHLRRHHSSCIVFVDSMISYPFQMGTCFDEPESLISPDCVMLSVETILLLQCTASVFTEGRLRYFSH